MAAAAVCALLSVGFAFRTFPGSADSIARWNFPTRAGDESGLGGGLTYYVEPDFCSKMFPSFADRGYIRCRDMHASMLRAFDTWAANHPDIKFMNATDKCMNEPEVKDCLARPPSGMDRGRCITLCSVAEIFIFAEKIDNYDLPAKTQLLKGVSTTITDSNLLKAPQTSSGPVNDRDFVISRATITFNTDQKVYMDSYFCPGMHRMELQGTSVHITFALIMMPFFAGSLLALIIILFFTFVAAQQHRERGQLYMYVYSLHVLTTPIWRVWCILIVLIISSYSYFGIAAPCVDGFDFEAAMVHYIGEALGLTDPEKASPQSNYKMGTETVTIDNATVTRDKLLSPATCTSAALLPPSQEGSLLVKEKFNKTLVFANYSMGPVMLTPTKTRVSRCPTLDDLNGLNMIYPTCSLINNVAPQCTPAKTSLGILRFVGTVFFGLFLAFMILWFLSWTTEWYKRRLESFPPPETKEEKEERKQEERRQKKEMQVVALETALETEVPDEDEIEDEEDDDEVVEGAGAIDYAPPYMSTPEKTGRIGRI